jgi:hypothetical protein
LTAFLTEVAGLGEDFFAGTATGFAFVDFFDTGVGAFFAAFLAAIVVSDCGLSLAKNLRARALLISGASIVLQGKNFKCENYFPF